MPNPNEPLWKKIDDLAHEAAQDYDQNHVSHILTQIACIARTHKRLGIKQLFIAINLHCANLIGEMAAEVEVDSTKKKS